jgi:hypothetical protein
MPQFTYPSSDLPPLPSFAIEAPEGWRTDEAPDTLAVFYDPDSPPGFTANLTVQCDRVGASVDLEDAARETLAQAEASYPAFQLEQERVVDVGGQPASLRFQSFDPGVEGVGRLMQMQVLFFAPRNGGATKDLLQINATCRYEDDDRYVPAFVDMAKSFTFRP